MKQSSQAIRVGVVEDREGERDHLVSLLRDSPGFACVAACASGNEALHDLPGAQPDVVLMDIQLPGLSGVDCVERLRRALPKTQFMMLTVVEDHDQIFRSLAAGATGYLLKKTTSPNLLEAIRELHNGGSPISGQIARQVVRAFQEPPAAREEAAKLSPTEQKVLTRLAQGLLYKEVADELDVSIATVRTHIYHIYKKLEAHSRMQAVLKGLPRPRI